MDIHAKLHCLPLRPNDCHKYHFGPLLIIAGDRGYPGAALLCTKAALETGTGLVKLCTYQDHGLHLITAIPEAILCPQPLLLQDAESARAIVIGPGCRYDSNWLSNHINTLLNAKTLPPVVLDAGALDMPWIKALCAKTEVIITPHPGEAAWLLKITSDTVQSDRLKHAKQLARVLQQCHVILKGSGTLIIHPNGAMAKCPYGNPMLASAGTGDVLAGLIGSLLAQGCNPSDAAETGVFAHAYAADWHQKNQNQCLTASHLITALSHLIHRRS